MNFLVETISIYIYPDTQTLKVKMATYFVNRATFKAFFDNVIMPQRQYYQDMSSYVDQELFRQQFKFQGKFPSICVIENATSGGFPLNRFPYINFNSSYLKYWGQQERIKGTIIVQFGDKQYAKIKEQFPRAFGGFTYAESYDQITLWSAESYAADRLKNLPRCSICEQPYEGFGNNPYPFHLENTNPCCDRCNERDVIPARMRQVQERMKQEAAEKAEKAQAELFAMLDSDSSSDSSDSKKSKKSKKDEEKERVRQANKERDAKKREREAFYKKCGVVLKK